MDSADRRSHKTDETSTLKTGSSFDTGVSRRTICGPKVKTKPLLEFPWLCRRGSRGLTFTGVGVGGVRLGRHRSITDGALARDAGVKARTWPLRVLGVRSRIGPFEGAATVKATGYAGGSLLISLG